VVTVADITDEMVQRAVATWYGTTPDDVDPEDAKACADGMREVLAAALEGCAVVDLPDPEADTGTIALWRPGQHDWLVIEAWADSRAIPLVRVSGSTKVAHVVRERALAMLAAADRAEQMAAEKTASASGSGMGDQHAQ
jgi:hypothetical protein